MKSFQLTLFLELSHQLNRVVNELDFNKSFPALPRINANIFSTLVALPADELPLWRLLIQTNPDLDKIRAHPLVQEKQDRRVSNDETEDLRTRITLSLYEELHDAMRKRAE
ncbi:hypothetical protein [Micromonospora sp. NPDC005206]|uniref:hypothetical protein n=1 Tax=Micromonospora sp. NPDC005206 TaxID=3157022 RepID=UPI00339FBD68